MRAQLCLPAARARDEMRGRASDPRAEAVRPERVGAGSVLDAVVDEHRPAWPSAGSQIFQVLQAVDIPKVLESWLAGSRKLGIAAHTRDRRALGFHSGFRQYWLSQELQVVVLRVFQVQELSDFPILFGRRYGAAWRLPLVLNKVCAKLITLDGAGRPDLPHSSRYRYDRRRLPDAEGTIQT